MAEDRTALAALILAAISVAAVLVIVATQQQRSVQLAAPPQKERIVVIPITAPLTSCWVDPLLPYILKLNSSDVAGIILYIDSPGGTLDATEALYGALKGLGKPVYAVVSGLDASGAFYVSMAAEKIYASPGSLVGNIGAWTVINPAVFWTPIPLEIFPSGYEKLFGMSLFGYYNSVDQAAASFLSVVVKSRGDRLNASADLLATGRLFTAQEALRIGLIDKIGGLADAVADMARSLGLTSYSVVSIYSYFGISPPNCSGLTMTQAKVPLGLLANSTLNPVFYIYPGAVQLDVNQSVPKFNVSQVKPVGRYVLFDLSHGNLIPEQFVQALASKLVLYNCTVAFATTSNDLRSLLKNAAGLVIVNPSSPYSSASVDAVESFTASGGRLLVFYDPRLASSIYITSSPPLPAYLDELLTPFGMVVMDGYLYNASAGLTALTDNWQFVSTRYVNSTELGDGDYVFFTPAAISGSGVGIYVDAHLLGFGAGRYAVVLQRGNVTVVGTVTSFLPDFVRLGNNQALLGDLAKWVCGGR
ncbi:MAG: S49 family peptidase [Thermoproteus sp.]